MNKRLKLNGWQRLWVMISMIWLMVVTGFTVANLPQKYSIIDSWAVATYVVGTGKSLDAASLDNIPPRATLNKIRKDIAKAQERYLTTNMGGQVDFSKVNDTHSRQLEEIKLNQAKIVGYGVSIWLSTILVLYLFGWSAGWVIRGFKVD